MNPVELSVLLHFNETTTPYKGAFYSPDKGNWEDWLDGLDHAEAEAHEFLERNDLILQTSAGPGGSFRITQKGLVLVQALTEVPIPVQKWVMP